MQESDKIRSSKEELTRKAQESLEQLKGKVAVYREGADEFIDALALYIKENPQRAAIIAGVTGVGLGLILGLLLRGGRRD